MVDEHSRKIIEAEIERMKQAYRNAQDRYGFTGSRSSDRTMTKYSTLIAALERELAPSREDKLRDALQAAGSENKRQHDLGRMSDEAYSAIRKALIVKYD